jgi:hypothetical protein
MYSEFICIHMIACHHVHQFHSLSLSCRVACLHAVLIHGFRSGTATGAAAQRLTGVASAGAGSGYNNKLNIIHSLITWHSDLESVKGKQAHKIQQRSLIRYHSLRLTLTAAASHGPFSFSHIHTQTSSVALMSTMIIIMHLMSDECQLCLWVKAPNWG